MNSIEKLAEYFLKFPGIGQRQAKRFVYFLLNQSPAYLAEISKEISNLKAKIKLCKKCKRYFNSDIKADLCTICNDEGRDKELLLVIERDVDLENMERSGAYNGYYFVLGGSLPVLEKTPEKRIRIKELLTRIEGEEDLSEIIIATGMTTEGENTLEFLKTVLSPIASKRKIKVSVLGRGLSTGTEIEYSDKHTIEEAIKNRH